MIPSPPSAETWELVGTLFDQLAALPPNDRDLDTLDQPLSVRTLLEQMLAAHDTADPQLLDQTVRAVAGRLLAPSEVTDETADYRGRTFGAWRALEEIGRGGMAVVLKGERADGQFEKEVAIKLLPHARRGVEHERLLEEIRILAWLEHPNIARLIDGGVEDGIPYLVMEYVHGVPITEYCDEHKLDIKARVRLLMQVIEAVLFAHRHLVVHCDIKPGNILVDHDGRARLVDFGIAGLVSAPSEAAPRGLFCSPAYCAPEQMRGAPPDTAQDIFSLGAVLYELLCGERVRDNRAATRMLFGCVASEPVIAPPSAHRRGIDRDLDAICTKALAFEPGERYASANALLMDAKRWLTRAPVEARAGGAVYRISKWLRRHWLPAGAATIAALALIIGTAAALWQAQQARFEANRALAALAQSEQSLRRARAVREFLVGLFRAAEPDRPRGQLPSTEEVLALGARRALDENAAPAPERFVMLHTLAEVYQSQNFLDQARPLAAAALALARRERETRPDDLARALQQQAWLALRERDLDLAEAILVEAEAEVADDPEHDELTRELRAHRGWVHVHKGELPRALAILEPLYEEISASSESGDWHRYQLMNPLQSAYRMAGNLESAAHLHAEMTPLVARLNGEDSLRYAIHLANGAGIKGELGDFDTAEVDLHLALELYDEIFDRPAEYRAAARHILARIFFYRGEYERAIEAFNESNEEWARARGMAPETYPFAPLEHGRVLTRAGRWQEAAAALENAVALLESDATERDDPLAYAKALQAWTVCAQETDSSHPGVIAAERTLKELAANTAEYQAQIHEARAECLLLLQRPLEALAEIEQALATLQTPGRVQEIADRKSLRRRILATLGRETEIAQE